MVKLKFETLPWKKLKCDKEQLRLDIVLKCGQSFRWALYDGDLSTTTKSWIGVLSNKVWLLSQDDSHLLYKSLPNDAKNESEDSILHDYFQLDVDLAPFYKSWSKQDPVFEKIAENYPGIRMLRQDPVENLFSFICSSNNNIQRISGMVENLCAHYGNSIGELADKKFFSFPKIENLAHTAVEGKLRTLGFGYRASYIAKTAKQLLDLGGRDYLMELRSKPYCEAKQALMKLSGIGPKVADCILLMSLDKADAIPVDTHMFQIASQNYLPHLKGCKSVTNKVYGEIGDHFRQLYGEYAGWAHSVLFSADLKHLRHDHEMEQPPKPARKRKPQD